MKTKRKKPVRRKRVKRIPFAVPTVEIPIEEENKILKDLLEDKEAETIVLRQAVHDLTFDCAYYMQHGPLPVPTVKKVARA